MMKKIISGITLISFMLLFSGCTSLMEKTGELLDGTITSSKTIAEYTAKGKGVLIKHERTKDGSEFLAISVPGFPNLVFCASVPDSEGNIFLTSYGFLSSSVAGWNEFTMDISAVGNFTVGGDSAFLYINSPIEIIGISSGKIRYNDQRLIADSALRSLNNRYERILALVEWMEFLTQTDVSNEVLQFKTEIEFQSYWEKIILPEMVKSKMRPALWSKENTEWSFGEDIKWNVTYTKQIFPRELYEYRNFGGLLRDWEEAISWIYLEYVWDDLCSELNQRIQLNQN
jgi:hypothetical protein